MTQGLKNLQDSAAYKRSAEMASAAKEKTASMWSSVASSQSFQNMSGRVGGMFGAAKSKISASMSTQNVGEVYKEGANAGAEGNGAANSANGSGETEKKE